MPGGGPALDGTHWVKTKHPTQKNRRKPFLVDNEQLSEEFRKQFLMGLRRLLRNGKLQLEGKVAWLQDEPLRAAWLEKLNDIAWNVFVEGPPNDKSQPLHVIKYLARYMSGGPIADSRLISHEGGHVTFWARTKDKANKSQPFPLKGEEFVRRWSMHILPKGYTRSRCYGGYHGSKRVVYLASCSELLDISEEDESAKADALEPSEPKLQCSQCQVEMHLIASTAKPTWRDVFEVLVYRERVYCPTVHTWSRCTPKAHPT